MHFSHRACLAFLSLWAIGTVSGRAETPDDWYASIEQATHLFEKAAPLSQMGDSLSFFTNVFTAIGYGAVMIVAVRKVMKARNGEDSMGWIASTMMTIALMATAPALSQALFKAGDSIATASGFSPQSAIATCWDSILVILPGSDSAVSDVLADASQKSATPPTSVQNDNASFTKLAWSWMKIAWSSMTNALGNITSAFRSVVDSTMIVATLTVPTMTLVFAMFAVELGMLVRSLAQECMQIFLPMMIACLSFAPMRAAATNFITRFVVIAFWPVAWALGNGIACSLLTGVITWVVNVCLSIARHLNVNPTNVGLLAAAAGFMNWTLLFTVVAAVSLCALLVMASAVAAPRALNSLVTSGTTFIGEQLGEAMRHFNAQGISAVSTGSLGSASAQGQFLASALSRIFSGASRAGASSGKGTSAGLAISFSSRQLASISDDLAIASTSNRTTNLSMLDMLPRSSDSRTMSQGG